MLVGPFNCRSDLADKYLQHGPDRVLDGAIGSQYCSQTKQYREKFSERKISAELGFEPKAAGWEARMLPLCYAGLRHCRNLSRYASLFMCETLKRSIINLIDLY